MPHGEKIARQRLRRRRATASPGSASCAHTAGEDEPAPRRQRAVWAQEAGAGDAVVVGAATLPRDLFAMGHVRLGRRVVKA